MQLNQYITKFKQHPTPFYFYDLDLMRRTFDAAAQAIVQIPSGHIHYALKANDHPAILQEVRRRGFGIDAVSGGEVQLAIQTGIPGNKILFAGVGKTDKEIETALEADILCFNAESVPEIEVINDIAARMGKTARIALRINPNIDAHTHKNITTGLDENKFGISLEDMLPTIHLVNHLPHVVYQGLHFHIGSQLLDFMPFRELSLKINEIQQALESENIQTPSIDVGGGLGVDYADPLHNEIPDFAGYIKIFKDNLQLRPQQSFHCELGRSLSAQYAAVISRVVFIKHGAHKQFAILDAGFTDLIRPALYQASHKIVNLTSQMPEERYDIVGPICESTDVFAQDYPLPKSSRGDLVALLSAGAYGHVMASTYNARPLIPQITSDEI